MPECVNRPVHGLRLAGLDFSLTGFPVDLILPPEWTSFESPPAQTPDFTLTLQCAACPCPVAGTPLNSSPYFSFYTTPDGAGLLGVPDGSEKWRAVCRPDQNRLEIFVETTPGNSEAGLLVDRVLWRFRMAILARFDRLVFHAAAAVRNGRGFLLAGDTGRGKSTLARLLHEAGWTVLSDESPIAGRLPDGSFGIWGSPWPSSGGFAANREGALAGFFCLEQAAENGRTSLDPGAAARRLLAEGLVLCPWYEPTTRDRILDVLDRLARTVPGAILGFKPDAEITERLAEWLKG